MLSRDGAPTPLSARFRVGQILNPYPAPLQGWPSLLGFSSPAPPRASLAVGLPPFWVGGCTGFTRSACYTFMMV